MKTLVFNVWKEPLEELIKKIPLSQDELNDWFDKDGAKYFEMGQGQYYLAHKSEYLNIPEDAIAYKPTREQLLVGFDKVFTEMKNAFSLSNDADVNKLCEDFKNECTKGKYEVVIAPRAPITSEYATMDPTKVEENIKFVIEQNKFLIESAQRHISSMEARLKQVQQLQQSQQSVPRNPSSPTFIRQPQIKKEEQLVEQTSTMTLGKKSP